MPGTDLRPYLGPDFTACGAKPYWFGADPTLLEIPMSVGFTGGLDHVQVDAVGEDVPGAAEHDHPYRTAPSVPVGSQEPAALTGAHGAAGEGELEVADAG